MSDASNGGTKERERSRRVLVTGLSTYWGGRLAQAIESDPEIETIIGVDARDPTLELQRTEYVRVGFDHALLRRIVQAAQIDTVIDTRLNVDSWRMPSKQAHENNILGTMNVLAACSGPESPVRKFVFKSSAHYYGSERDDPAFFTEAMRRPHAPRTALERDIVEAERAVAGFAERHRDVTVTILRFANGIGPTLESSHLALLGLPVVPAILGFDPRYQFIHEDDIVGCLRHALEHDLPGIYNAAGDGVLVWSEVASLLGKPLAPVLPPVGTGLAAQTLKRLGVMRIPPEVLQQLRFGRAIDNRRLKAAGYRYQYTTREAVAKLAEHQRVAPMLGDERPYRYEREIEDFLRYSPSVQRSSSGGGTGLERYTPQELAALARAVEQAMEARGPVNTAREQSDA